MYQKYPEAPRPAGEWLPVATYVAGLPPCAEAKVGSRSIAKRDALLHLSETSFPACADTASVERNKVAAFSPVLAVHLEACSKVREHLPNLAPASVNNLLVCLYITAVVTLATGILENNDFVLVLPAFRPLHDIANLPSSRWHTKALFREVRAKECRRRVGEVL